MEVVINSSTKQTIPRSGIALLISLSIVTLLSIALMSAFENRSVEVAHLENSLERFQAETLSRSILRAVLLTIKQQGLVYIVKYKQAWQNIPISIQNGSFQIREIQPVDHLFNLNHRFDSDANLYRSAIFKNLVNRYYTNLGDAQEPLETEVHMAISAINDWTDSDGEGDEIFMNDFEQYPHANPAIEVKNHPLDRLGEVNLLEPFSNLKMSKQYLEDNFRVFSGEEFLDVNLADEESANDFFDRLENVTEFENIYANRAELIKIIVGSTETDSFLLQQATPLKFPPPVYSNKKGESAWQEELEKANLFAQLKQIEKEQFKVRTDYIRIRYQMSMNQMSLDVESIVKIEYINLKKSLDIKGFQIVDYRIY